MIFLVEERRKPQINRGSPDCLRIYHRARVAASSPGDLLKRKIRFRPRNRGTTARLKKGEKEMRLTTTDLYESGFLHCAGAYLADVWNERNKASTVVFVFDGDYRLEELQKSYHNGTATVNLADYRQSLETLKDVMFRILRSASAQEKKNQNQKPRRNRNAKSSGNY